MHSIAVEDLAQVEEPGERCGAPGARGAVAIIAPRNALPQRRQRFAEARGSVLGHRAVGRCRRYLAARGRQ